MKITYNRAANYCRDMDLRLLGIGSLETIFTATQARRYFEDDIKLWADSRIIRRWKEKIPGYGVPQTQYEHEFYLYDTRVKKRIVISEAKYNKIRKQHT